MDYLINQHYHKGPYKRRRETLHHRIPRQREVCEPTDKGWQAYLEVGNVKEMCCLLDPWNAQGNARTLITEKCIGLGSSTANTVSYRIGGFKLLGRSVF